MHRQAVPGGDRAVLAFEMRIDRDKDQCADELQPSPEVTGGRDHCQLGMRPFEFFIRIAQGAGRPVQMTALRASAHIDRLQHLGLKGGPETLGDFQPVAMGSLFKVFDRGYAEIGVEFLDPVGSKPGQSQHFEHALRRLGAHLFKAGILAGFIQPGDDGCQRIPDAGDFRKPVLLDMLVEGDCAKGEIVCRPAIGPRSIGIPSIDGHMVADLAQQSGDLGGAEL